MFRTSFHPLLLLTILLLSIIHPAVSQTSATAAFAPTVPATAGTATATAGATSSNGTQTVQCPARYHDCAVIGRPEACCALDQVCVYDESSRIACCPFRTHCVGTLDTSSVERTAAPFLSAGRHPFVVAGAVAALAGYWMLRGVM